MWDEAGVEEEVRALLYLQHYLQEIAEQYKLSETHCLQILRKSARWESETGDGGEACGESMAGDVGERQGVRGERQRYAACVVLSELRTLRFYAAAAGEVLVSLSVIVFVGFRSLGVLSGVPLGLRASAFSFLRVLAFARVCVCVTKRWGCSVLGSRFARLVVFV